MKKLLSFSFVVCFAFILASCGDDTPGNSGAAKDQLVLPQNPPVEIPPGTVVWAEQVQSTTEISRPGDWDEKDWNEMYRNIDREQIFNTIKDAVMKGELVAYNYFDDSTIYTPKDIEQILNYTTVIETFNEETGQLDQRTVEHHLGPKDISVIKVKEKWLFDPKTYHLHKVVTDLGFFVNSYTSDSLVRGTKPLFYVKLGKKPGA